MSGVVVGARLLWVYPAAFVPRWLSRIQEKEKNVNPRTVTVVAWTGMRRVVSLTAALSLPLLLHLGTPFPHRNLLPFLTFAVIVVTLVGQGRGLPGLIRGLGIRDDK